MRTLAIVYFLCISGCLKKTDEIVIDQAKLTCYAGEKIFYQITTEPYKIHSPSEDETPQTWEIDSDQGKVIISGTCIYKIISN